MPQENEQSVHTLIEKWGEVLNHEELPKIADPHRRAVTAVCLENTQIAIRKDGMGGLPSGSLLETAPVNATGDSVDNYDPVLISLVRRSLPNLVAYDLCGVQPMTGPTGLIFALRTRYATQEGTEAFYNEANTGFAAKRQTDGTATNPGEAATNVGDTPTGNAATYNFEGGTSTTDAEALGGATGHQFPEMAFSIEKQMVTAESRALKAEYTMELAQDLKAIHGLDAETELANILSTEILAEINREIVRTVNLIAEPGAREQTATAGTFDLDTDSNGRWMVEKFKGLMFQFEREANQIAKQTRRGKGNIILCSSDVASAMAIADMLDYDSKLANEMMVDDTGSTYVGMLNNRFKVYIDPYFLGSSSGEQYATVGYKGSSSFDAGLFYCPYVPLQMVRAVGENSFQPKIGFKTRYGIVENPFARGTNTVTNDVLGPNQNKYYRRLAVANLM